MPPAGEFARIARFVRRFPRAKVPVGIGDDCAVVRTRPGHELCVTTDSIVEDVHFTRAHFSPEDIGHKALAVNVSDLAAMGARPTWFLCALQLPAWVDDAVLDGVARGMRALAKQADIALVGGNFSGADKLSIAITAAGEVPRGRALLRSGGRAGDILYVSGELGDARYELSQMKKEGRAGNRQARPQPRVELGLIARAHASCAIDLSDGLAQDLGHLLKASKTGARVALASLPTSAALRAAVGATAQMCALQGGEDYELLLAVPPSRARRFEQACSRSGQRVTRIGELTGGRALQIVDPAGRRVRPPAGFDHFASKRAREIDPHVREK